MTEQTSPAHPKAHAASGPSGQSSGQPSGHPAPASAVISHAPSPLDIAARAGHRDAPATPAPAPGGGGALADKVPKDRAAADRAIADRTAADRTAADKATADKATADKASPDKKARAKVTGSQALVLALESIGVDVVFGIPGGAVLPAYDPLLDSAKIRHILVRHEQGAGHAATGYAQATGRVGVCMATSGPGATNLVTPLADAYMDSVPVVA